MLENNVSQTATFEDDPASDTLWVIFMPQQSNAEEFAVYEHFRARPGKKLFLGLQDRSAFNSHDPETHKTRIDAVADMVRNVIRETGAKRVIGWGNSRGGYYSVVIGCLVGFDRIIAVSPELILGIPHSRSSKVITDPYPPYATTRLLMDEFAGEGIDLFIPCFSAREGINVTEARKITSKKCNVHFFMGGHYIQSRLEKDGLLPGILRTVQEGGRVELPLNLQAPLGEIELAEAAFIIAGNIDSKKFEIPAVDDSGSKNLEWFFLKAKVLNRQGKLAEAIRTAERSFNPKSPAYPRLVFLAQLYLKAGDVQKAKIYSDWAMSIAPTIAEVKSVAGLVSRALSGEDVKTINSAVSDVEDKWRMRSSQTDV